MDTEYTEEEKNKKTGGKWIVTALLILLLIALLSASALILLWQLDGLGLHMNLSPGEEKTAYGEAYEEPDVEAYFGGTDLVPELFYIKVEKSGEVDTAVLGTCEVEYRAAFLWMKTTVVRTIEVCDLTAPNITLIRGSEISVDQNSEWTDPGYAAADNLDGDVTALVQVSGQVDTSVCTPCELTYTVTDQAGNEASVMRRVTINDKEAPVLTLSGEATTVIKVGEEWNDPGCTALDNLDGSIETQTEGSVDTGKAGVYKLTYTAQDAAGNEAQESRTVYVTANTVTADVTDPGDKIVYLTFDDGPGKYTQQLLDVLDKYNVKATFFVTNQFSGYQDMIRKEYEAGHTVAIHSYTHEFSKIYTGEDAFYEDVQKMADICKEQTGVTPTILRFPGGTSNTVSRKYCSGIMTSLTESCQVMGYRYCDWNVDSCDAGGAATSSEVAANVISGIKQHKISYVLQHDIKGFSVNAVEEIIRWGLENGYTFLPLTDSSPMCHHRANN